MVSQDWKKILVPTSTTIVEALKIIDGGGFGLVLVVDARGRLIGTVTDGDVRRGILRGVNLTNDVSSIMNSSPSISYPHEKREDVIERMKVHRHHRVPVVDENRVVVGLHIFEDLIDNSDQRPTRDNWVVLMAGGLGARLGALTKDCPKPLLKVGGRPILETILANFVSYGFHRFFISVNYRSEMIHEHFGDGSKWGATIEYLHEKERLGTAGSLSLLPGKPELPVIVMNGDLLTRINFEHFLTFHSEHKSDATMAIREYDLQVPYGIVRVEKERITRIEEKPLQKYFVNAGIYALSPEILSLIPQGTRYDMTTLFERVMADGRRAIAFPIREYWLDIGQTADFHRASEEFSGAFSND